ncbi:cytochrome c [Paraconexibacter sp.]|uniref:c-type cytochrome n=1 Tax=Paraconexibacter sp. TaxID=2949640 RepID=UPI003569CA74
MRHRVVTAFAMLAVAGGVSACGSQGNSLATASDPTIAKGAKLFVERCSGCHTMDVVGAEGGAVSINGRERVDGPNFNVRKEDVETVLYAIRNGGFSGAIMPENLVTGEDAQAVAEFLAKYAGNEK